jgi:SAM-dependent methyltransferase
MRGAYRNPRSIGPGAVPSGYLHPMSTIPEHDAVDWAARYREGNTPWDRGHAHGELARRLASGQLAPPHPEASCYVPGCGRGHDARALCRAGWRVTAQDIVEELAEEVGPALDAGGGCFVAGDAFEPENGPFDLIWEHTFLCAIRLEERERWAEMVRRALRPGGRLAAIVFPANKPRSEGGPPWGYSVDDLLELLGPGFELLERSPLEDGLEDRQWAQEFVLLRRR